MEIISEVGVPMTNGEVYALVRRRRDERNAAQHPPFCLQLDQADAHNRASSQYIASKFGSSAAAAARARAGNAAPTERGAISPLESANAANAILATPAAGHLVILLTEVKLLNYLANHSHLSAKARIGDVYGPASVYEAVTEQRASMEAKADEARRGVAQDATRTAHAEVGAEAEAEAEATTTTTTWAVRQCARVQSTAPGTVAHVRAVEDWLHAHEQRGQAQESRWALAIKQSIAEASANVSALSPSPTSALKTEKSAATQADEEAKTKPLSAYRVLLSEPTALPFREALSSSPGRPDLVKHEHNDEDEDEEAVATSLRRHGGALSAHAPAGAVASTHARGVWITDDELLRLVVGRPQSTLDLYRLIDHLEERFGDDEEKLTAWCARLEAVFATRVA